MAPKQRNDNNNSRVVTRDLGPDGVTAHKGKVCGTCTACCTVIPVAEIGLPAHTRCSMLHTFPDMRPGCKIYDQRPTSCRVWSCAWLAGDLPNELRPDRCGFVVDPIPDTAIANGVERASVTIWALRGFEDAWQSGDGLRIISMIVSQGMVAMWYLPPDAQGRAMARGFQRNPATGTIDYTEPFEPQLSGALRDQVARMNRAQELLPKAVRRSAR